MFNAGNENYVSLEYVKAICGNPSAAPIKRHLQNLKTNNPSNVIDFTNGSAVASIIYLNDGSIVLTNVLAKTIKKRYEMALLERTNPNAKKGLE